MATLPILFFTCLQNLSAWNGLHLTWLRWICSFDCDVVFCFHIYNCLQGELVEESSIQRSSVVTAIVWHPVRKILAIGWQSGDVLMWNEHDRELHEASSIHQSAVRVIQWSNNGNRLVTTDEVIFYWEFNILSCISLEFSWSCMW